MNKAHYKNYSICSKLTLLIFITCSSFSYAATPGDPVMSEDTHMKKSPISQAPVLMLAEVDCIDDVTGKPCDGALDIPSGTLVIPGEGQAVKSEKKCVRVCDKWGKRCNINPRTGQKKCMRMCESFGEDCF